jgi:transposase, IS5 family
LQLDADLAPIWRRESRDGVLPEGEDLFGFGGGILAAAGVSYAGHSRRPIRLMCSVIYLKHAFNLSDEETCERWAENVVWQYFSATGRPSHGLLRTTAAV